MINTSLSHHEFGDANDTLFARIASDLREKGYSINPAALPETLGEKLYQHLGSMEQEKFDQAGIGRDRQLMQTPLYAVMKFAGLPASRMLAVRGWIGPMTCRCF